MAALEAAKRPFFCTGTFPLDTDNRVAILVAEAFRGVPSKFNAVYFPLENEGEIQSLLDTSHQASFGRGRQDVIDPSYRHALVLHKEKFAIYPTGCLEPHGLGILTSIAQTLLLSSTSGKRQKGNARGKKKDDASGHDDKGIRIFAHLDKLNVYTEGGFFKAHVDTPRSPDMFGTLLINMPVRHEGGQLVVRAPTGGNSSAGIEHDEYTTNWGHSTNLEWIAFFSDCEHEVLPVTSGNRVTISYTLSFDTIRTNDGPIDIRTLAGSKDLDRDNLYRALTAPGIFTEEHPRLCFYMEHKYPMDAEQKAGSITRKLKGRDAVLYHALIQTGVSVTFHHVFFFRNADYYGDGFGDGIAEEGEVLGSDAHAILPRGSAHTRGITGGMDEVTVWCGGWTPQTLGILEVTKSSTKFVTVDHLAYGNEASIATEYGTVCMVATMQGLDLDEPWKRKLNSKRRYRRS